MSWSYSGNPADSILDEVRFLIGDTNSADQQLSNEEIQYNIDIAGSSLLAAAYSSDFIASRYKSIASKSVGDLSITYSSSYSKYQGLAQRLYNRATFAGCIIHATGQSVSEKRSNTNATDIVKPGIKLNSMDATESLEPPIARS